MNKQERDYINQIDQFIMEASPQILQKIAEIDKNNQLSGISFYDVFMMLPKKERRKITISK